MLIRSQYRCSFKELNNEELFEEMLNRCKEALSMLVTQGRLCNVSFYRYENMGFLYLEEMLSDNESLLDIDRIMEDLKQYLKPWPEENGDRYFVKMINVYYHYIPEENIDEWEKERTTSQKDRIGRLAFVFPDKLPSYVRYHNEIVEEGLLKGDKYAYISMHENILFSYFEEPRNNVNIKKSDEQSTVIEEWLKADPESHFDRIKAQGNNFLVIKCLFSVDRVDFNTK